MAAANPIPRKGPDPAGRLDLLAIRLLERAAQLTDDMLLRSLYGVYRKDINRSLRRHLGKYRVYLERPPVVVRGGNHAG